MRENVWLEGPSHISLRFFLETLIAERVQTDITIVPLLSHMQYTTLNHRKKWDWFVYQLISITWSEWQ